MVRLTRLASSDSSRSDSHSFNGATVHTKFEQSNYNNLECVCKQVAYWIYDNAGFSLSKFEKRGNIPCREPDYVY